MGSPVLAERRDVDRGRRCIVSRPIVYLPGMGGFVGISPALAQLDVDVVVPAVPGFAGESGFEAPTGGAGASAQAGPRARKVREGVVVSPAGIVHELERVAVADFSGAAKPTAAKESEGTAKERWRGIRRHPAG